MNNKSIKLATKKAKVFTAIDAIAQQVLEALLKHVNFVDASNFETIEQALNAFAAIAKGYTGYWDKDNRLTFKSDSTVITCENDARSLFNLYQKLTAKKGVTTYHNPKPTPLPSVNAAAIELAEGYLLDAIDFNGKTMNYDFESLQSLNDIAPNVLCLIKSSSDELGLGIKGKDGAYFPRYKNENGTIERVKIAAKFLPTGSVADFIASKLESTTLAEPVKIVEVAPALVEPAKTSRLEVLKNSLVKKENELDARFKNHFDTVRQANGQPLNDKRNGRATLNKWEKQNDDIRNQQKEVEKTKKAIEREEYKIDSCALMLEKMTKNNIEMIENGTLKQWRKFPDHFFVDGVDKGRIIIKNGVAYHKYLSDVSKEQYPIFRDVYNKINKSLKQPVITYHFTQGKALAVRDDVLRLLSGVTFSSVAKPSTISSDAKPSTASGGYDFLDFIVNTNVGWHKYDNNYCDNLRRMETGIMGKVLVLSWFRGWVTLSVGNKMLLNFKVTNYAEAANAINKKVKRLYPLAFKSLISEPEKPSTVSDDAKPSTVSFDEYLDFINCNEDISARVDFTLKRIRNEFNLDLNFVPVTTQENDATIYFGGKNNKFWFEPTFENSTFERFNNGRYEGFKISIDGGEAEYTVVRLINVTKIPKTTTLQAEPIESFISIPDDFELVKDGISKKGDFELNGVGSHDAKFEIIKNEHIGFDVDNFHGIARKKQKPRDAKTTTLQAAPVDFAPKTLPLEFSIKFEEFHTGSGTFGTAKLTQSDNGVSYGLIDNKGKKTQVWSAKIREMLASGEWKIIEPKPKPRSANLSKMARAGIMILGWFFARELFNAAGQGNVRKFLSQGLRMAWSFDTLTDADFSRFFAACTDDAKRDKVYALYCEVMQSPKPLSDFNKLSAPIEYRADCGAMPPPENRRATQRASLNFQQAVCP